MCGTGTSSHIIVCMWNLSGFLCKNPKCPGAQGRRPLCQSHFGGVVLNCALLAVVPAGIVLVCFVLIKHDRISRRVTRVRTLGKYRKTLSLSIFLVRWRNFKPKNIPCVEVELQNFKSHNSLCAEAELQVT